MENIVTTMMDETNVVEESPASPAGILTLAVIAISLILKSNGQSQLETTVTLLGDDDSEEPQFGIAVIYIHTIEV